MSDEPFVLPQQQQRGLVDNVGSDSDLREVESEIYFPKPFRSFQRSTLGQKSPNSKVEIFANVQAARTRHSEGVRDASPFEDAPPSIPTIK